jgi:hypothetical protein
VTVDFVVGREPVSHSRVVCGLFDNVAFAVGNVCSKLKLPNWPQRAQHAATDASIGPKIGRFRFASGTENSGKRSETFT